MQNPDFDSTSLVSADLQEILDFIEDPELRESVRRLHTAPPEQREQIREELLKKRKYTHASEIARELEEEHRTKHNAGKE